MTDPAGMSMDYIGVQRGIVTRETNGRDQIQLKVLQPQLKNMTPGEEVLNLMDQTTTFQNESAGTHDYQPGAHRPHSAQRTIHGGPYDFINYYELTPWSLFSTHIELVLV